MNRLKLLSTSIAVFARLAVGAQADTINTLNNKLQTSILKEGKKVYLFYTTDSLLKRKIVGDIWVRETRFENRAGKDIVVFDWTWMKRDSVFAEVENVCEVTTLSPMSRRAVYQGYGTYAYKFLNGEVFWDDTVRDNRARDRTQVIMSVPALNWELDLETLPLLKIKKVGQKFAIAFFDPNGKAAAYRDYLVSGEENLSLNKESNTGCWILKYSSGADSETVFWISKNGKEVLKTQSFYKGNYYFKVLQF
jgi:hypothetical protein